MPKQISENELKNIVVDDTHELADSCNKNHCVTKNTKLIIVGTITPPAGAGYFYTAPRNKIYGYIDECGFGTTLKPLKKQLHENKQTAPETVEEIKKQLVSNNIAFLDVIKCAVRKKDSPADGDISHYVLDVDSFKIASDAVIICNSRLAEQCYIEICEKLNKQPNHIFLSQRSGRKVEWLNAIKNAINKNQA